MRLSSYISLDLLYIHNGDEQSENLSKYFRYTLSIQVQLSDSRGK